MPRWDDKGPGFCSSPAAGCPGCRLPVLQQPGCRLPVLQLCSFAAPPREPAESAPLVCLGLPSCGVQPAPVRHLASLRSSGIARYSCACGGQAGMLASRERGRVGCRSLHDLRVRSPELRIPLHSCQQVQRRRACTAPPETKHTPVTATHRTTGQVCPARPAPCGSPAGGGRTPAAAL
jgi:hypothetical protein